MMMLLGQATLNQKQKGNKNKYEYTHTYAMTHVNYTCRHIPPTHTCTANHPSIWQSNSEGEGKEKAGAKEKRKQMGGTKEKTKTIKHKKLMNIQSILNHTQNLWVFIEAIW